MVLIERFLGGLQLIGNFFGMIKTTVLSTLGALGMFTTVALTYIHGLGWKRRVIQNPVAK